MEPRAPALGARSLSHWTTREVLHLLSLCCENQTEKASGGSYSGKLLCQVPLLAEIHMIRNSCLSGSIAGK